MLLTAQGGTARRCRPSWNEADVLQGEVEDCWAGALCALDMGGERRDGGCVEGHAGRGELLGVKEGSGTCCGGLVDVCRREDFASLSVGSV